ncbi:Glyoxylase, beta-lactamase superfamily II [Desulfatibacillum alkenivorans DSM 16219]|jgi:glyoxylase-like metal-dependent hydrolase (beta-lactamase superfamily II)|uniref:Glyoxylase, beta-lactamase superfamily II n=1 Tax=Desulfatibacillum alkenivorans DSM 16219 TaxID=1121393 RepID=A0A1M6FRC6_9BACT|nr:MBL fold metallo-hydrolase [Desulfatibacillum alkenivorans]SHJ00278.1 Glyoxylase, beta-lactamase superfamily II [Desulfatibacillum alkenivorans DSM 16219]
MAEMYPKQFSEHVWILVNQGYPIFLVKGNKECALVEGSLSCAAPMAMAQFQEIGVEVPLKYLLVAHEHSDHVCGFVTLKKESPELIIAGSRIAADILAKEKVMTKFVVEDKVFGDVLLGLKLVDSSPEMLPPEPMVLDEIIEPGQVLDLGGVTIEAIATPGHSPGSLSFFVEPDKTLLMSDAAGLGGGLTQVYPMFFYSFEQFVESLRTLKATNPERLALGHDLVVEGADDCQAFLDRAIAATFEMQADMKEQLAQGRTEDQVALDWAHKMHAFGMFELFPDENLMSYTSLLLKRALEA